MTGTGSKPRLVPVSADLVVTEGELLPVTRRLDLKKMIQVRREMALTYREVRNGSVSTTDGAKLIFMLAQIGKMIQDAELERRLRALEGRNGNF